VPHSFRDTQGHFDALQNIIRALEKELRVYERRAKREQALIAKLTARNQALEVTVYRMNSATKPTANRNRR